MRYTNVLLALGLFVSLRPAAGEEPAAVLRADEKPREMLRRYLDGLAAKAFAQRKATYQKIQTPEDVATYQKRMSEFFWRQIGGRPPRTPLRPKLVGRIDHPDCRIEKLLYESQPGFHVTALLYLPRAEKSGKGPYPAVLVPCGHSRNGKAYGSYQRLCILLARHGMAALCYDPIGQGERYQILDGEGRPKYRSTDEHTLVGASSILVGRNTATYRIWDGMRGLDLLSVRPEIDGQRLACAGNSGGGTLTEYLMALEPRIKCAAPGCAVTSFEHRIATGRIGDAEQNIYAQLAFGMDHADYLIMRAPQPTLIAAATHDFVDIQGTWDVFREAKRIYTRLGHWRAVDLVEADRKHGMSRPLREATVAWMQRWLLGVDRPVREEPIETLPEEKLRCTPRGQVMLLEGEKSVLELNREVAKRLAEKSPQHTDKPGDLRSEIRGLLALPALDELPRPKVKHRRTTKHNDYRVDQIVITSEPGILVPARLFVPAKETKPPRLYVHDLGMLAVEEEILRDVKGGRRVLTIDVRGVGETGGGSRNLWGGSFDAIFISYLLGKPLCGQRTLDIRQAGRVFRQADPPARKPVEVVAFGVCRVPALHAAALDKHLTWSPDKRLRETSPEYDWKEPFDPERCRGAVVNAVHGALAVYDLATLQRLAGEETQAEPPPPKRASKPKR